MGLGGAVDVDVVGGGGWPLLLGADVEDVDWRAMMQKRFETMQVLCVICSSASSVGGVGSERSRSTFRFHMLTGTVTRRDNRKLCARPELPKSLPLP